MASGRRIRHAQPQERGGDDEDQAGHERPERGQDLRLPPGRESNYAADRAAAGEIERHIPHAAAAARQNREFVGRVVGHLAGAGVRQFLDIGSGLPLLNGRDVHEIAQRVSPDCRVVYVDYDAVAVSHAKGLLESGAEESVTAIGGDLRDPGQILRDAKGLLDFGQPVAVLLFAVLHFLRDDEDPHGAVSCLKEALSSGGALAISHITGEGISPDRSRAAQEVYEGASAPAVPRTRDEITRFFDGLHLVAPGVTDIALWPGKLGEAEIPLSFYGGAGIKPQ
ncbi:MAG TPA: SAM-dependent methyltransferase [Trebonia sp.]